MRNFLFVVGHVILISLTQLLSVLADDTVVTRACEIAAKQQLRLEAISAFKLHGIFISEHLNPELETTESEVWMESRGEKLFAKIRKIDRDGDRLQTPLTQIAKLLDSDLSKTLIFDGQKMIVHDPLKMRVTIESAEKFDYIIDIRAIHPASWTCFLIQPTSSEKISFRYFIREETSESKLELSPNGDLMTILHSHRSEKPSGFKFRRLDVSAKTGLIVKSEAYGVFALPIKSEMEWKESDKTWYVAKGMRTIGEGNSKRVGKWEIDEFSADPLTIRSNFTLDESKLPLGTMIETEPQSRQNPRSIRYVGGEEGEREYELKTQAIKIIFKKEREQ